MKQILILSILGIIVQISSANVVTVYLKYFKEKAENVIANALGKTECAHHLSMLVTELVQGKTWALEMIDASAKVQPGLLAGNLFQLGNFDQCLKIRENKTTSVIQGQYCTVILLPSTKFKSELSYMLDSKFITDLHGIKLSVQAYDILKFIKLTYGVCIPRSCSISNLQDIWDYLEHTFGLSAHAMFVDLMCSYEGKLVEPYPMDKYVYAFFGLIIAIMLVSTAYDLLIQQSQQEKQEDNMWLVFSMYTNGKNLFTSGVDSEVEGYMTCINGIKVISMFWVIQGHRFAANIFTANLNGFNLFEWRRYAVNTIIISGSFAVDTFIALSGLLLSYAYLKLTIEKGMKVKLVGFYIYRFLRLSAPLLATVLFYCSVFKNLSSGPAWPLFAKKLAWSCRNTGWATMLFLTNFLDLNYQCIEQSWYLAVDSQLYFISPVILFNMVRHPYKTTIAATIAGIISALYAFKLTVDNKYGAIYFEGNKDFLQHIYQPTFIRMTPWLIGLMFGYMIFMYRSLHIPKAVNILLWVFSLGIMVVIILSHLVFTTNDYDALRSALFNALSRPIWGLAVCLIIFSCATGNGGIVNKFLSLWIFNILVKLSYCIFLVHLGVILFLSGGKRTFDHFHNLKAYHDFWGDLVFTLIVATAFYLAFEAPVVRVTKILYKRRLRQAKATSELAQTENNKSKNKRSKKKKNYVLCVYSYDKESGESEKVIEKDLEKKIL